jgi:hypothetical protein
MPDYAIEGSLTRLSLSGEGADEVLIEPALLKSSSRSSLSSRVAPPARRKWRFRLKAKRAPFMVAAAMASTALAAPGPAVATEVTRSARTPIHHIAPVGQTEAPSTVVVATDDLVTQEQVRALNELLALPLGPEDDISIDDWA